MKWKDISSHSQGDKERVPNAWQLDCVGIRLRVHRHIYHEPTDWLLSGAPWFDKHKLASLGAEDAMREAEQSLLKKIAAVNAALHDA